MPDRSSIGWPKAPTTWIIGRTLFVSIPFTWNLPIVMDLLRQKSLFWDNAIVGGPAVKLMPTYFDDMPWISIGDNIPDALQRVNRCATKTTIGCPNRCPFCAVPKIEGRFQELDDWPDLPILTDNNLLASSMAHFDMVIDRLIRHKWCDFNQGIDARLLTMRHAERIAEIKKPIVRLALDGSRGMEAWEHAFNLLVKSGISKTNIRTYALIAFNSGPKEAWNRCEWIESHGVKAYPMWFHELNTMVLNGISRQQTALGWEDSDRKHIMGYYYQHRGKVYAA